MLHISLLFIKVGLAIQLSLKVLFPINFRKENSRSGNESLLRNLGYFNNERQTTITMNRITKLIHVDGFTLNGMCFHPSNDISVIWILFSLYHNP